jgi:2',3'-cyclic-nucleotide 2'-phosphodiesterase (5'-nucleotidase family)
MRGKWTVWNKALVGAALAATIVVLGLNVMGCTPAPAEGKLQIFYTGNLRGSVSPCGCKVSKGGVARLQAFMQRQQDPEANWLLVDAGNFVDRNGATGGCSNKCQFMLTSYEGLKFDVLNIARQEISMGFATLSALRDTTESVEFVSANIVDAKKNKLMFKPYVIKDYGNMKVGILGLIRDEDFPANTSIIDTTELRVTSTAEAAKHYLPELQKKVNAVVLLCELPTDDIEELIKDYPFVDFVISTGPVRAGEGMTMLGTTRVVGSGSSGYNGHWAMLEMNPTWGDSLGYSDFRDQLTDSYDVPGELTDKLAAFEVENGLKRTTRTSEQLLHPESNKPDATAEAAAHPGS